MELKEFLEAWRGAPEGLALKYDTQGGKRTFNIDYESDDNRITCVWPRLWLLKDDWHTLPMEVVVREITLIDSNWGRMKLNNRLYVWNEEGEGFRYASDWDLYEDSDITDYFWRVDLGNEEEDEGNNTFGVETHWPFEEALVKVLDALKVNPNLTALEVAALIPLRKKKRRSRK